MDSPTGGADFLSGWAAIEQLLTKACHLPSGWHARPSLRCSRKGASLLVTWIPVTGEAAAATKKKRRSPASVKRSEARRAAHTRQNTATQQPGAPAAAHTQRDETAGTAQQPPPPQEQQPRSQPAAAPAQEEKAVTAVVEASQKPPHSPPRIQPPASKRQQPGPPAAIVRIGTEGQSRVDGTASSRKRPKGSAGRLVDQLIPEEICGKMHPRLRVEICNWVTNMQDRHISPDQPELSLEGRWFHWGPEPFIDSSGCNTTTWEKHTSSWL
jgi:hypothetical protein